VASPNLDVLQVQNPSLISETLCVGGEGKMKEWRKRRREGMKEGRNEGRK
jgi:hypothetical protein